MWEVNTHMKNLLSSTVTAVSVVYNLIAYFLLMISQENYGMLRELN